MREAPVSFATVRGLLQRTLHYCLLLRVWQPLSTKTNQCRLSNGGRIVQPRSIQLLFVECLAVPKAVVLPRMVNESG